MYVYIYVYIFFCDTHTHMGPGNFQIHGHLSINPQLIFPLPMNAHVSERLLVFNLIHVEVASKKSMVNPIREKGRTQQKIAPHWEK